MKRNVGSVEEFLVFGINKVIYGVKSSRYFVRKHE